MGADLTIHLIFGFVGNKKELKKRNLNIHDDKYLPYIEGHPGILDILVPSNSTDYFIFGRSLSNLDSEDNDIRVIEYLNIDYYKETQRLTDLFIQLFGQEIYDSLVKKEPVLMHFNQWS
jgi:hypothetical protein